MVAGMKHLDNLELQKSRDKIWNFSLNWQAEWTGHGGDSVSINDSVSVSDSVSDSDSDSVSVSVSYSWKSDSVNDSVSEW